MFLGVPQMRVPKMEGFFYRENLMNMDDLGVPYFRTPPHICLAQIHSMDKISSLGPWKVALSPAPHSPAPDVGL